MRVGKMRNKVVLTTHTPVSDGAGGWTSSNATLATVWADMLPMGADKILRYGMTIEQQAFELILHWPFSTDIDSKKAITVDGVGYRIKSVMPLSNMKDGVKLIIARVE